MRRPTELRHEASKSEQQLVGEQVLVSMASYDESLLDKFLTDEQKNAVKVHAINNKGVKGKDRKQRKRLCVGRKQTRLFKILRERLKQKQWTTTTAG
jgi:hypothetical protein